MAMTLNQNPISRLDAPLSRVAQDLGGSRFVSRQLCRRQPPKAFGAGQAAPLQALGRVHQEDERKS